MAKVSYVISKNSTRAGKSGFHFDGNTGNGKWFTKIFKDGKEEHSSEPNEIVDLVSKLVVDSDCNCNKTSETRIEFEGSVDEIKEFGVWSVNQIKAEAGSLKSFGEFIKEYCKSLTDMVKDMFSSIEHIDQVNEENADLRDQNDKLLKENETLRESLKKSAAKKGNTTDSKNQ